MTKSYSISLPVGTVAAWQGIECNVYENTERPVIYVRIYNLKAACVSKSYQIDGWTDWENRRLITSAGGRAPSTWHPREDVDSAKLPTYNT
jgi:hypothetical protein